MFGCAAALAAWWPRDEASGVVTEVVSACGPGPKLREHKVDGKWVGKWGCGLTQCAYRGEIEEVLAMLAAGASVNQKNKNGSTALHLALQQRHADLATLLVTEHQADVNAVTNKFVTPLMVAVTCCMHTGMVQMLLDAGADPLAMNWKKERAGYMAAGLGHVKAAELLSVAEAAATVNLQAQRAQHADDPCRPHRPAARCPECDEVINLGQIRRIEGRVADNDESNLYVREFAQSGAAAALKCEVWCHRSLNNTKLRKEVTETWAVIKGVERILEQTGLADCAETVTFVDLCCGKSLTAALLNQRYPKSSIVAVDRVSPGTIPHFRPPLRYLQADIHAVDFAEQLAATINPGSPIVLCGMHLCGALSPCAVELAESVPMVVGLVLSPCCLPNSKLYDNARLSSTRIPAEQYAHWCSSLAGYISLRFSPLGGNVECYQDTLIKSIKDHVVVGWCPVVDGATTTTVSPLREHQHPLAALTRAVRAVATQAQDSKRRMLKRRAVNNAKRIEWDSQHRDQSADGGSEDAGTAE